MRHVSIFARLLSAYSCHASGFGGPTISANLVRGVPTFETLVVVPAPDPPFLTTIEQVVPVEHVAVKLDTRKLSTLLVKKIESFHLVANSEKLALSFRPYGDLVQCRSVNSLFTT